MVVHTGRIRGASARSSDPATDQVTASAWRLPSSMPRSWLLSRPSRTPTPLDQLPGPCEVHRRSTRGQSRDTGRASRRAADNRDVRAPLLRSPLSFTPSCIGIPGAIYSEGARHPQQLPTVSGSRAGSAPLIRDLRRRGRRADPQDRPMPCLLHVCSNVAVRPGSGWHETTPILSR